MKKDPLCISSTARCLCLLLPRLDFNLSAVKSQVFRSEKGVSVLYWFVNLLRHRLQNYIMKMGELKRECDRLQSIVNRAVMPAGQRITVFGRGTTRSLSGLLLGIINRMRGSIVGTAISRLLGCRHEV